MLQDPISRWVETTPLTPIEVDCATAVMLKILDGKCKMDEQEKRAMTLLYEKLKDRAGAVLDARLHDLIAETQNGLDDALRERIYEKRVLAETMIRVPR